mgnify:CR=1 FL=1
MFRCFYLNNMVKEINGYNGLYEVSDLGNVYSLNYRRSGFRKELIKTINTSGYYSVILCKNGVKKTFRVHRLVAIAFIENPENKETVNHIDVNKLNNHISNLEWNTVIENNSHSYNLRINCENSFQDKTFKKVINTKTGEIFNSVTLAAESIGYIRSRLSHMLRGVNRNKTNFKYL